MNLGKKQSATSQKQQKEEAKEIEVEENDEYVDDDFDAVESSSNSENEFAKASVSQSGRLPPLSAANPLAAMTNRSFSSNLDMSKEGKLANAYKNQLIATDSGKKSRSGFKDRDYVNLADSGDNIVDFDLSESRYTSNPLV